MNKDVEKRFEKIEKQMLSLQKKIDELEGEPIKEKKKNQRKSYKGLIGAIYSLYEEGFFDEPKFVKEVKERLFQEGQHHVSKDISSRLIGAFVKNQKILLKIKDRGKNKYVVRK